MQRLAHDPTHTRFNPNAQFSGSHACLLTHSQRSAPFCNLEIKDPKRQPLLSASLPQQTSSACHWNLLSPLSQSQPFRNSQLATSSRASSIIPRAPFRRIAGLSSSLTCESTTAQAQHRSIGSSTNAAESDLLRYQRHKSLPTHIFYTHPSWLPLRHLPLASLLAASP